MSSEKNPTTPDPVCADESLRLLNCVASEPFDREKCVVFLDALRSCVLQMKVKKFSLAEPNQGNVSKTSKDGH